MSALVATGNDTLPTLIDRAASALSGARNSAEVLESRDMARVAYDAARTAGRMAKAKDAHDAVIGAVYRAQADAALIEARAKMRLADEYDAAQERGEVGKSGTRTDLVGDDNEVRPATASDLGIRRDEIHEARKLRDAEAKEPGKSERVMSEMLERGEEPTKAKLRRAMIDEDPRPEPADPNADARRALAGLSREGLEDELIGLRDENKDLRSRVKSQRSDIADLQSRIKELTECDTGRTIGNLQRRLTQSEGRSKEHQANAARLQRQVNAQKAEIDKMRKSLENQVFQL